MQPLEHCTLHIAHLHPGTFAATYSTLLPFSFQHLIAIPSLENKVLLGEGQRGRWWCVAEHTVGMYLVRLWVDYR